MDGLRYPINVRMIGVMHKEKTKLFMTSVLWSDHNDIIVYRGFSDFKKLHKQMKKAFPPASPLKRSDRIIPKFKDKKMLGSKKGPSKSVMCLKFLEKYCGELLTCAEQVSQSPEIIRFFLPKDQDLQPEFAKNSIVIMPSEDSGGTGVLPGRTETSSVGNVSQPFVTEEYRCLAPYETKDTRNQPFKVAVDENVDVLIKDKAGWWLVENEAKCLAWFPAPYLEKIEADEEDELDGDETCGESVMYCATKKYKATKRDEVSLDMGSVVEVLLRSDNGWWLIRYKGKAGYVPAMYLKPYSNPRVRLQNLQKSSLNLSSLDVPAPSPAGRSDELSRSLPPANKLPPGGAIHKSRSLNVLSDPSLEPRAAATLPSPTIMVEGVVYGDRRGRSPTGDSDELCQSSDSSFSDVSSSSASGSSSLNLSGGYGDERFRLSRTPPPMAMDRLSPDGLPENRRLTPSKSDSNLFKTSTVPKVPPRPREQEILTRCTTITRRKASRGHVTPGAAEIASH